jgi:hypothetical protein
MNRRAELRARWPIGLITAAAGALALTVGLTAGATAAPPSTLPQGGEPVVLNPADFTTEITNPYFPLVPGTRFVYREQDAEGNLQRGVTHVTSRRKLIANGITARVVHDVVSEHGQPVEKTFD